MVEEIRIENFIPIDDRVIVRPHGVEEKTEGGIYLPPAAVAEKRDIVQSGEVIAVGPGRFTSEGKHEAMMDLQPGDTVFFARFQGWLFTIEKDGEEIEYRIFGAHDLFGHKKRESE